MEKTSILWYLLDNNIAERHYVYVDTESVADATHFYRKKITPETKFLLKETTPNYISSNIDLTEKEFYSLLDKALKKGDYNVFFKIGISRDIKEIADRNRLLRYLQEHIVDVDAYIKETNGAKIAEIANEIGSLNLPYFYFAITSIVFQQMLFKTLVLQIPYGVESLTSTILPIVSAFNFDDLTLEEEKGLFKIIVYLLAMEYYQLAFKFLTFNRTIETAFDLLKKTAIYLESNCEDKSVFLNVGSEYTDAIYRLAGSVLTLREAATRNKGMD